MPALNLDYIFLVFARYGTNEKIVVPVPNVPEINRTIQRKLNEQLGGDWIVVDQVGPGEFIKFTDGMKYQGFTPKIKRYTDALGEFEEFKKFMQERKDVTKN